MIDAKTIPHVLSSAQRRMWLLEKFDRVPYLYNVPFVLQLPSTIDLTKLHSAIELLCQSQPQLCSFFIEEEEVKQHYFLNISINLSKITLQKALPETISIDANHPLSAFFLAPFHLNEPPLIRFAIASAPQHRYLLISCHHLIIDAWSMGLFLKQLSEVYAGQINLSLQVDYSQYAQIESQNLQHSVYAHSLQYWETQRQNKTWEVDLITDFARTRFLSGRGSHFIENITDEDLQKLREFARKQKVSVNHVVLSVFQLVLGRYSGQDDITLGIPVVNRQHKQWLNTIGLFVNTCLYSNKLDYTLCFADLLSRTKTQLLNDISHADIPYDYLIKYLYQKKLCAHDSGFNILYNYVQIDNAEEIQMDGVCLPLLCLLPISKFDLSLHGMMTKKELKLILEYSTDLFQWNTIQQVMNDFKKYLNIFLENPNEVLSKVMWML